MKIMWILYIAKEAEKQGFNKENIYLFKDKDTLLDKLKSDIKEGDVILFKASNAMRLYDVAEGLKQYLEK